MDILSRPVLPADHRIHYGAGAYQFGDLWIPQTRTPVPLVVAGAVDLRLTIDLSGYFTFAHDKQEVFALMGGGPQDLPGRYKAATPGDLLPFHVPQLLIQGTEDDQIPPELPLRWAEMARRLGDTATVNMVPSADHLDVVDPESRAWGTVRDGVRKMVFS
jgi:pimeloyl-ACP methyl ester carboxylesterase